MIEIKITGVESVMQMLNAAPKQAQRAMELAIDYTVKYIGADEKKEMLHVFDQPTTYTLNAVVVSPTRGHVLEGSVALKVPPRMAEHYLAPQVDGGARKLKGFERGIDDKELVPGPAARMVAGGNVSVAQIKAVRKDVQGESSTYFYLPNQRGKLAPGVYQRGERLSKRKGKRMAYKSSPIKRGINAGKTRDRWVKAIFHVGRTGHQVKPLLDFYGVAHRTANRELVPRFWLTFSRLRKQ